MPTRRSNRDVSGSRRSSNKAFSQRAPEDDAVHHGGASSVANPVRGEDDSFAAEISDDDSRGQDNLPSDNQ
ncbi:hypothetical protein [Fontivita pretiosa]|uniref:hypothetical protein n=1 Tax=Fontivita pretiosa TaxID=2989684 RepID=UPI003D182EF3